MKDPFRSLPLRPAIIGILLAPFLTIFLPFRQALVVQAILIALLSLATIRSDRQALSRLRKSLSPTLAWSLGIIVFFGLSGTLVGLLRGYAPAAVLGQALSVLLLPIGAIALCSTGARDLRKSFQRGLLEAALIGGSVQLLWGIANFFSNSEASRLFLPNAVSTVQFLPMALIFLLAARAGKLRWKYSNLTLAVLLLLLILSSLRSLWILTPVSILLLSLLLYGLDLRRLGSILLILLLVGGSIVGSSWIILHQLEENRINLLPQDLDVVLHRRHAAAHSNPSAPLLSAQKLLKKKCTGTRFPVPESPGLLLNARSIGGDEGAVVLSCRFFDRDNKVCGRIPLPLLPSKEIHRSRSCGLIPEGAQSFHIRVSAWEGSRGNWELASLQASPIKSGLLTRTALEALSLQKRATGLTSAIRNAQGATDATLSFRLTESIRAWEAIASAPPGLKLVGHGLGATLRLDTDGFDNRGHWIHYAEVNYLHNWYLFLLYKLGILGALGVLFSISTWMWMISRRLIASSPGSPARSFHAAALASWISYLVWSLSSPEILDFRMAPIWGFLLAAALVPEHESPKPKPSCCREDPDHEAPQPQAGFESGAHVIAKPLLRHPSLKALESAPQRGYDVGNGG